MRCLYESPQAACKQLKVFRADWAQNMVCRAHNHRRASESRWYVVPSAEWPPFAHAMLFADWSPTDHSSIRIGALVCRGLGAKVAPHLTKPTARPFVLQRHWRWREIVMEHWEELLVEPVVTAAASVEHGPLQVEVAGKSLHADFGDPYEDREGWDRVIFTAEAGGKVAVQGSAPGKSALPPLRKARSIDDVARTLRTVTPDDWLWTELLVYRSLQPESREPEAKGKPPQEPLITTHELYESLITPFEAWLFTEP